MIDDDGLGVQDILNILTLRDIINTRRNRARKQL